MAKSRLDSRLPDIRDAAGRGDWEYVIRCLAQLRDLGDAKTAITRAWEVSCRPDSYREMGYVPADVWRAGVRAACQRYLWAEPVPVPVPAHME
jgi:hypothetical protein